MIRSALSLAGLLVACAGAGLFVAIGIYAWTLKAEVNQQTTALTARANEAGDAADHAIKFVREVIGQAEKDLTKARGHASDTPTRPVNPLEQMFARRASTELAGSVERAHGAVVTASDAVKVAQAALEVFHDDENLRQFFGVRPDQLTATQSALGNVSGELRQAKSVLGVPVGAGDPLTTEQLNAVDGALKQASGFTDELAKVVTTARGRVNDAKTTVDQWSWRVAIATSLISALAAVGQVFMVRFFWRRLRGLPA
jgi:hypothetical protein